MIDAPLFLSDPIKLFNKQICYLHALAQVAQCSGLTCAPLPVYAAHPAGDLRSWVVCHSDASDRRNGVTTGYVKVN